MGWHVHRGVEQLGWTREALVSILVAIDVLVVLADDLPAGLHHEPWRHAIGLHEVARNLPFADGRTIRSH